MANMHTNPIRITTWIAATITALFPLNAVSQGASQSSILDVNYRSLVSRADLHYTEQVRRSGEGLPVGNGTMGSLVWTTPKQLKLQINRVDVFAADRTTNSFPFVDTDYSHGCAFVDFSFADYGPDTFPADNTRQHLSVYDGLVSVTGSDVRAEVFAWPHGDAMAVRITDERREPTSIRVKLRTLRPVTFQRRNHFAFSRVGRKDERITLRQQFVEGDDSPDRTVFFPQPEASSIENRTYYGASSVAVSVLGRGAQVKQLNDGAIQLVAKPGKGTFTVLIASAASFDIEEDVNALALAQLDKAASQGDARLSASAQDWWHDFWSNSFVHLSSPDGEADYVEQHYTYFLYVMASSSRGAYPPRYSGMLWNTDGDVRRWGSMKWMYNLFCYYNNVLLAANKKELTDPPIEMFHKNYDATALAARQQWGSQGIYIQETMWFNGPAPLPDDIAEEMRDLYLVRKPWSEASERFLNYAASKNAFDSRWCWKNFNDERWIDGQHFWEARESSPYSYVLHLFAPGAKIAYFHWLRYDYTRDKEWLREYGYPIIRGVAEFYRNYPNVKKEADGKYHIHGVNNWESTWGASDTIEELAAMRAVTETAIRASEELGVDEDMRPVWQEFLDNMTPLPTFVDTSGDGEQRYWINTSHSSVGRASTNRKATTPSTYYDLFTQETTDPDMIEVAKNSYVPYAQREARGRRVSELSKATTTAATMGDAEGIKNLIPAQIRYQGLEEGHPDMDARWARWRGPLRNRLSLMEGYQGMGGQRLGNAMNGLVLALCRATPPGPAGKTVIRVFPAWPKEWDAAYTLLTRGNFLVTSSMKNGDIEFVEIKSQSGGECRLRNPWGEQAVVTIYRDGAEWTEMNGSLLTFKTSKGENFIVVRKGSSPDQYERAILGE
ncbi:MAG: glycoside hydrolase family 95-like protein [Gammaproteobacteria bacterium]